MPTDRIGVDTSTPAAAFGVPDPPQTHRLETTRPGPRRLPLEQAIAATAWVLVVVNVQPWVRPSWGPQGQVVESSSSKGVVMAGIFMVAVALAAPRFSARLPATYLFYLGYLFVAAATAFQLSDPVGPLLRVGRLGLAIAIPILLWPWLAGRSHLFLSAHRRAHLLIGLVVLAGIAAAPGSAWAGAGSFAGGGRLQGAFLPMLPPRVGEIGAILVGLTATALAFRKVRIVPGAIFISLGLMLIILSRTRTAAVALLVGLIVAFCLTRRYRLGRRALRTILLLMLLAIPLLAPIQSWVLRNQNAKELSSLTGRTHAWSAVVEQQSSWRTVTLGHGLGNKEVLLRRGEGDIGVMAIDNGWLTLFWETGLLGVGLVLSAFAAAVAGVLRAPTPYIRAATGFLVVYVAIASFTETGLSDLSLQTLHLMVASGAAFADRLSVRGERPMLATLKRTRPQLATFART